MTEVSLTAPLTRGRQEFGAGDELDLPASLAGKLVDRGRAKLRDRVVLSLPAPTDGGEK